MGRRAARRHAVPVGLALLASACGMTPPWERQRAATEAKLAAIEEAGAAAKALEPLSSDSLPTEGPAPNFAAQSLATNAMEMDLVDFDDLTTTHEQLRLVSHNPVDRVAAWLRKGETPSGKDAEKLNDQVYALRNIRYLLITRSIEFVEPRDLGGGFASGAWREEALLFDLEQRKLVGGIRVTGANSDTAKVDPKNAPAWLRADLRANTARAIEEAFRARYPTVPPPKLE